MQIAWDSQIECIFISICIGGKNVVPKRMNNEVLMPPTGALHANWMCLLYWMNTAPIYIVFRAIL